MVNIGFIVTLFMVLSFSTSIHNQHKSVSAINVPLLNIYSADVAFLLTQLKNFPGSISSSRIHTTLYATPFIIGILLLILKNVLAVAVPFNVYVPSLFFVQVTPLEVVVSNAGFNRFFVNFVTIIGASTAFVICLSVVVFVSYAA